MSLYISGVWWVEDSVKSLDLLIMLCLCVINLTVESHCVITIKLVSVSSCSVTILAELLAVDPEDE